jgi:ribosomal protein S18 acetylase RimI-like enzyme
MVIRNATSADRAAIWNILEPTIRAGATYPLPRDMSQADAFAYWFSPQHEVFVADADGEIVGTYYLKANQQGGGQHVANCGYMTSSTSGGRGIGTAMCRHSLDRARERGFLAMQFNFVVSTNTRAVRLWESMGFEIVGELPEVFRHPEHGLVTAFVMHRRL